MTLLGNLGDPAGRARGTASVEYCDDVHGSAVLVDVDGGPDEVLTAAIRYVPTEHPPAHRMAAADELLAILDGAGWRPLGPIVWGPDDFRVRVEKVADRAALPDPSARLEHPEP